MSDLVGTVAVIIPDYRAGNVSAVSDQDLVIHLKSHINVENIGSFKIIAEIDLEYETRGSMVILIRHLV